MSPLALLALYRALVVGVSDMRPLAEDAISALRCFNVVGVEAGDHHFVIEGWLPATWVEEFSAVLEAASLGRVTVVVEEEAGAAITTAPTALSNVPFARPYEILVEMYAMPGRSDYDPTFATFLFMPLFFGLMLGDAGYGVALLAASWVLGRYFDTPLVELVRSFLRYGGAWAIGFGFLLFGEVFGWSLQPLWPAYPYFHRSGDLFLLFVLAIVVGATHVNVGLLMGFRAVRRRQGLRIAFLRKVSWIILENGAFLLMLAVAGIALADMWYLGVGVMATATALLAWGGGVTDVIEIPSFIGNLLSYLRIAVVGVAKSALASTLNAIVIGGLFPLGPFGWALGALLLAIGHGFVLALAVATIGIQSLRLHYVEFYSKFYETGSPDLAERFRPSVKRAGTPNP